MQERRSAGNAAYAVEMTDGEHERLAELLHAVKGMVLLSSYPNEMYDGLYASWTRVERQAHADGAVDRVEVLWMNPKCAAAQRQQQLIA